MKSLDNRLESASIGFLGSAAVAQNFPKKMLIKKKQSSKYDTQFSESVRYEANIRRNLKEAPAIVTN